MTAEGPADTGDARIQISVVVPVRDGEHTLTVQLDALAAQQFEGSWEVVIADNGSTDGTVAVARRYENRLPQLRIIDCSDDVGINHARNAGARAALGDFILLCDADDEVAPGWLAAMADAAAGCDMVGGRMDEATLNDPVTRTWRLPLPDDMLPVALDFLPYAVGANCGFSVEVFRRLGGFDGTYVRGGADTEFFWRGQLAGFRLCFVPDAVVRYRHRDGLRKLARQTFRYGMSCAQLFRHFRHAGMPRRGWRPVLRDVRWIVRRSPDLVRGPQLRGVWVRRTVQQLGRLRGSVQHHVLYL